MGLLRVIVGSFCVSKGRRIPLGNLTSQLFANIYLHEMDFHFKHYLRIKYYLRYCDDFIFLDQDREKLTNLIPQISSFLFVTLKLNLHPNKVFIRSWKQGVDFLGYVLLPMAKTRKRMLKRAAQQNHASYLGLCKHTNAHRLTQLLLTKLI